MLPFDQRFDRRGELSDHRCPRRGSSTREEPSPISPRQNLRRREVGCQGQSPWTDSPRFPGRFPIREGPQVARYPRMKPTVFPSGRYFYSWSAVSAVLIGTSVPFLRSRSAARKRWRPPSLPFLREELSIITSWTFAVAGASWTSSRRRAVSQVTGCLFQCLRNLCGIQFDDRSCCLGALASARCEASSEWSGAKASARAVISAASNPDCPESFRSSSAKARSASRNGSRESVQLSLGLFELLDNGLELFLFFGLEFCCAPCFFQQFLSTGQLRSELIRVPDVKNPSPEPRAGAVTAKEYWGEFSVEDTRGHGGLRRTQPSLDELHPR